MNSRLTVCLDSNIYVSAIGFGGRPLKVLELALEKDFLLVLSNHILNEVQKNLLHKVGLKAKEFVPVLHKLADLATFVLPAGLMKLVDDPNDNLVLETALMGFADVLVTGDRELVNLKAMGELKIETITIFLERWR